MHQKASFFRISNIENTETMTKYYKNQLTTIELPDPPPYLFSRIMNRIQAEKQRLALRRRFIVFSIILAASVMVLVPVLKMVHQNLVESGFIQFLSLLFSDSAVVVTYWQSFVLTLLESLPAMSLIALLAVIFIFLESVKFVVHDAISAFKPNLINN